MPCGPVGFHTHFVSLGKLLTQLPKPLATSIPAILKALQDEWAESPREFIFSRLEKKDH